MTTRAFRKSSIAVLVAAIGAFSAFWAFSEGRAASGQTPSGPSATTAPPVVRAALHAGSPRQTIYGFGGSITYGADSTADFAGREAAYEAIFSELRIDILRLRNWNGYAVPGSQDRFEKIM